jgi:D-alanyl-lipoteichoic acid acyltransferase DltB (MBOAT superfamily)
MPFFRTPTGYLALSALPAIAVYKSAIFGYVVLIFLPFAFTWGIERLTLPIAKIQLNRWRCARASMLLVLGIYAVGRLHYLDRVVISVFNSSWTFPVRDMWLLLRVVSFLWEFGSGGVRQPGFLTYAVWITLPFGLVGPLIRYSEFFPQYSRPVPTQASCIPPYTRTWWLKLFLSISQMTFGAGLDYLTVPLNQQGLRWLKLLVIFGTGPWAFFLKTSGTFHLMQCLAGFWGIELPTSFNYPFGQPNISEFWARWNMTVTRVCRDYLFYNRWGFKKVNVYLNLLLVFLSVGLWHDTNWYWAAWGLLHGTGFCVYLWYRTHRERLAFIVTVFPLKVREITSRALTYTFVCLCWYVANKITFFLLGRQLPYHLH